MITSVLSQLHGHKTISPNFDTAIQYVLSTDFKTLATGKYAVDGDNVFAIVNEYTTKPASECDPESHRDYADIQIMIIGTERFGYTPLTTQMPTTAYNADKDFALYTIEEKDLNYITLHPGQFIMFFPTDIHQPEVFSDQPAAVKKVVIKVALRPVTTIPDKAYE